MSINNRAPTFIRSIIYSIKMNFGVGHTFYQTNATHRNITNQIQSKEWPIVKQKLRLRCTTKAYSSVATAFTTYFIEERNFENDTRPRRMPQQRNNDKIIIGADICQIDGTCAQWRPCINYSVNRIKLFLFFWSVLSIGLTLPDYRSCQCSILMLIIRFVSNCLVCIVLHFSIGHATNVQINQLCENIQLIAFFPLLLRNPFAFPLVLLVCALIVYDFTNSIGLNDQFEFSATSVKSIRTCNAYTHTRALRRHLNSSENETFLQFSDLNFRRSGMHTR